MVPRGERHTVDGLVGPIEVAVDRPQGAVQGVALIGHPHPLYGGTLDNKVAATLARALAAVGYLALRPNFRGVGASAGEHDEGRGETDDFVHLIAQAPTLFGAEAGAPLALAGFSFGSFVAATAAQRLAAAGTPAQELILVGSAAGKWPMPKVPAHTLVIHGEQDETIELAAVLDWARPQDLPVVVLPGADHFFHRRLSRLKALVMGHLLSRAAMQSREVDASE